MTMFISCGGPRRLGSARISSAVVTASTNMMSAPASAKRCARSMAASKPCVAAASVRAMMRKSGSWRASTAALILATASSVEITSLPEKWPQRLGATWSSSWMQSARALEHAHGVAHVERVAEAGVGVDDQRQVHRVADARGVVGDLMQAHEALVRHAEPHVGDAGAGDVDRLEAEVGDHLG